MPCCICGKDVTGLPVIRGGKTNLECCEECASRLGGPEGFLKYAEWFPSGYTPPRETVHIEWLPGDPSPQNVSRLVCDPEYTPPVPDVPLTERYAPPERPHKPPAAIALLVTGSILAFYGLIQLVPILSFLKNATFFPVTELVIALAGASLIVVGTLIKKRPPDKASAPPAQPRPTDST